MPGRNRTTIVGEQLVRELRLRRRRSRVPWIFVVYHRHETDLVDGVKPRESPAAVPWLDLEDSFERF